MVLAQLTNGLILMGLWMTLLWLIQLKTHNAAIVDVGWAVSFLALTLLYVGVMPSHPRRHAVLLAMVGIWSLRLAFHLWIDRVWRKPEDPRYHALRIKWTTRRPLKFFILFQFQAGLAVLVSLPFLLTAMNSQRSLSAWEWLGASLWLVALIGESVADAQLKRFKADASHQGQTCRVGLWNYSRHPNYFFEWLVWVAFAVFALGGPWGWTAAASPAIMLFLLLNLSGIPLTEAQAMKSRGDDYRHYQQTTSMFIPWFKKTA